MPYVTLSFGGFASHITTHWLNLCDAVGEHQQQQTAVEQNAEHSGYDAIDPDALHHLWYDGVYRPRLVLCDASGSAGAADVMYKQTESTDQECDVQPLWSGSCEMHSQADDAHTSAFRRALERGDDRALADAASYLESDVDSWADFLQADLSPGSVQLVQGIWHNTSPVASYYDSVELLCASRLDHVINETRRQAERCDRLAGLHVVADAGSAFGRASNECIREMLDDLGDDIPIASFGCSPTTYFAGPQPTSAIAPALAHALYCADAAQQSTMHFYMQCPSESQAPELQCKRGSYYHEAAVLASCIDSCTLPWRLREQCSATDAHGALDLRAAGDLIARSTSSSPFCSAHISSSLAGTTLAERKAVQKSTSVCPWTLGCNDTAPSEWTVVRGLPGISQDDVAQTLLEHEGMARRSITWTRRGVPVPLAWPHLGSMQDGMEEAAAIARVGNPSPIAAALEGMSTMLRSNAGKLDSWGWLERSEVLEASEALDNYAQCYTTTVDDFC